MEGNKKWVSWFWMTFFLRFKWFPQVHFRFLFQKKQTLQDINPWNYSRTFLFHPSSPSSFPSFSFSSYLLFLTQPQSFWIRWPFCSRPKAFDLFILFFSEWFTPSVQWRIQGEFFWMESLPMKGQRSWPTPRNLVGNEFDNETGRRSRRTSRLERCIQRGLII